MIDASQLSAMEAAAQDERMLNILFVCERTPQSLAYIKAFAERGHRFTMYTDHDRALAELRRRPFKFDMVYTKRFLYTRFFNKTNLEYKDYFSLFRNIFSQ